VPAPVMPSASARQQQVLRDFALFHIGSGKDIDDVNDNQKYGHIVGLSQRHKWGLDPSVGTPLQLCAARGGMEGALLLIEAGADVNYSLPDHGHKGATPLLLAIKSGDIMMVKMFLEQGADRGIKADMMGLGDLDACDYARVCASKDPSPDRIAITQLVEYFNMPYGRVDKVQLTNYTDPISAENPVTFVRQLIGTGRDINDIHGGLKWAQTPDRTPLAAVASQGDVEAVRLLLAAGANVNQLDSLFGGPLHYAIKSGCVDLVKVLLDAGADKHIQTNEPHSLSALEYARLRSVQDPNWTVIRYLVEYHSQTYPAPIRPGM